MANRSRVDRKVLLWDDRIHLIKISEMKASDSKNPASSHVPFVRGNASIQAFQKAAAGIGIAATGSIVLDAGHSNAFIYTEQLVNTTFTGFNFKNLSLDPNTIAGPGAILRKVSVNATLNASTAYTYANDLAFYIDPVPLTTNGRLQVGGFSNLSATTRLVWPSGGSSAIGTVVTGSFSESSWISSGSIDLYDYFLPTSGIWIGNGYGAGGTSGTWTGTLSIEYDPVYAQAAPVPAPLPLAGAAASFAWARTLRRRIRSAVRR
ncbi:MAG: hypothetical protein VKI83_05145 [Synechococcaceae cyanobacterium]|nr:hypothetical protein [Synechococcaceae cyanobacterium]